MKKVYNSIYSFFLNLLKKVEITKTFIVEWYAIFRKKHLYTDIVWTNKQQDEFDAFWKEHYGKKISNRWHRLYEAITGVYRIDYFPEILYSVKYEPMVNNLEYSTVFSDKTLNDLLFNNKLENVRTPNYYLFNNHGHFYDSERNIVSLDKAIELLRNIGEAVIKPTVDSSSGKNVCIIEMSHGKDKRTGKTAKEIIQKYKNNFIVQERIKPCIELETLYSSSINTIRVISYILNNSVHILPISLRIGGNGSEVDNIHAGGMSIGVKNDGTLRKYAYRLGYGDSFEKYTQHPDTNVIFEGYKLSFIDDLIMTAKKLHGMTANIGIISWDFTIDNNGSIVVIEANYKGQSVWFPQMLSGEALFGENTANVLKLLKNK